MTFGEKLQDLRQRAGMSQEGLSEKLNVSRQAVSRWERDETMPEVEKIVVLADLFGVTIDYLLRPEKPSTEKEPDSKAGTKQDWIDKLTYLAKTKGYLLGWLLIVWGVADLLGLLGTALMLNGFLRLSFQMDIDHIIRSTVDAVVIGTGSEMECEICKFHIHSVGICIIFIFTVKHLCRIACWNIYLIIIFKYFHRFSAICHFNAFTICIYRRKPPQKHNRTF
jgi:transcriptional regulator with XRE-family HTH domain